MAEVPKFVKARLAAQPPSGEHLDANMLAAFAENALTEREREPVFAHLAACAECREVLSLIAPAEAPPAPLAVKLRPRQHWIYRPFVHWAAFGVAAVILVAVALLHRPTEMPVRSDAVPVAAPTSSGNEQGQPQAEADKKLDTASAENIGKLEKVPEAKPELSKDKAAAQPSQQSAAVQTTAPMRKETLSQDSRSELKSKPAGVTGGVVGGTPQTARGQLPPSPAARADIGAAAAAPSDKPAAPPPPPPISVTAEAETVMVEPAPAMRDALARQSTMAKKTQAAQAAAQTGNQEANQAAKQEANQAASPMANTVVLQRVPLMGLGGNNQQQQRRPVVTRVVWSVTPEGQVVRTIREDLEPQPVTIASGVRFRAVTAVGQRDVWAGGDGGALYHSVDNGNTWTRVPLSTSDAVVAFEFSSLREGTLTTSGGKQFVTKDGGQTWKPK